MQQAAQIPADRRGGAGLLRGVDLQDPVAPILSVAFCLYLIVGLPAHTFLLFAVWLGISLVVYFSYSIRNSQLSPTRAKSGQGAGQ